VATSHPDVDDPEDVSRDRIYIYIYIYIYSLGACIDVTNRIAHQPVARICDLAILLVSV